MASTAVTVMNPFTAEGDPSPDTKIGSYSPGVGGVSRPLTRVVAG